MVYGGGATLSAFKEFGWSIVTSSSSSTLTSDLPRPHITWLVHERQTRREKKKKQEKKRKKHSRRAKHVAAIVVGAV